MLVRGLNIGREEDVCISNQVHIKAVGESEMRKRPEVRKVPGGLSPIQTFWSHISHPLSMYFREEELFG